jgi:ABC-type branched-subunit amino acid transport system permease subunit
VLSLTQYWRLVFGATLAAVVLFFPRGLTGLLPTRGRASA